MPLYDTTVLSSKYYLNSKILNMSARFNTLDEWLEWQESLHWTSIDLGLKRLREVAERMQLLTTPFTLITVGGTNGKGSTVAMLEAILIEEGYRTGSYTSPYLYRYNERIKLSGEDSEDTLICAAFEAIDKAREADGARGESISLTYFEFATLAAIWIFKQKQVQVAIMEVGMGGRLDAVNLWDADVAIITSIGIDHVKWLGDNREDIGREKSGIMRSGKPVISGDLNPPESINKYAAEIKAILYQAGDHFSWKVDDTGWVLRLTNQQGLDLPFPALQGDFQFNNAAVAIAALSVLKDKLDVSEGSIRNGFKKVRLAGRLEQIQTRPDIILDVAHNAHAVKQLALWLSKSLSKNLPEKQTEQSVKGKTYALFSMLDDKDITEVVKTMTPHVDRWFVSTLDDPRGLPVADLVREMRAIGNANESQEIEVDAFGSLELAWNACKSQLTEVDKVIVFGSFLVLSQFKVIF